MMNRFLPVFALVLSACALLVTSLLWREVRALRLEASQRPIRARISDEQFAAIKDFVDYEHRTFEEGHVPRSDVLLADLLLHKARYMHGDISQEEWHRLSLIEEPGLTRLLIARLKAGAGTSINDISHHYDELLESSR